MAWPEHAGEILLPIAREAIEHYLKRASLFSTVSGLRSSKLPLSDANLPEWANEPGACFITLMKNGDLRGCIGSLMPHRSIIQDVRENAVSAAVRDPRFSPLTEAELNYVSIELSLLSPIEPFPVKSEAEALANLRPGVDGIILEWHGHRSTFLPQVWEQLPDPELFLANLKLKAGLASNFWADDIELTRYTVSKWKE
ncbi:MAG: AmmeMemoRadiSam system protein A [Pseudomonadota bacterium]